MDTFAVIWRRAARRRRKVVLVQPLPINVVPLRRRFPTGRADDGRAQIRDRLRQFDRIMLEAGASAADIYRATRGKPVIVCIPIRRDPA